MLSKQPPADGETCMRGVDCWKGTSISPQIARRRSRREQAYRSRPVQTVGERTVRIVCFPEIGKGSSAFYAASDACSQFKK